jgi:hypothetical protein
MRSMRPVSTMVLVGMWLGGLPACSSVLMNTPVSKNGEGWSLTLGQVKEGPDEYVAEGGVAVSSGSGERLIWALLTVKNDSAQEPAFSYDTCVLQGKGEARQPLVVDRHADIPSAADRSEDFAQGQERTRQLIYSYPKDQRPTRMKCGTIVLPVQGPR